MIRLQIPTITQLTLLLLRLLAAQFIVAVLLAVPACVIWLVGSAVFG